VPSLGEDGSDLHYQGALGDWLLRQKQLERGTIEGILHPEIQASLQALADQGINL